MAALDPAIQAKEAEKHHRGAWNGNKLLDN
jgi:hypothetical protein